MPPRVIKGIDELKSLIGQRLGTSDWFVVTQERIEAFADGTDDHQWIHCDPERARRESPYGTTIAHGFLTLSLSIPLTQQIYAVEGVKMIINYGLNRVRFPAPVRAGARVRMTTDLLDVKPGSQGVQIICKQTFEVEGESRPACVAETVARVFV